MFQKKHLLPATEIVKKKRNPMDSRILIILTLLIAYRYIPVTIFDTCCDIVNNLSSQKATQPVPVFLSLATSVLDPSITR